ncbi:unnamed protein product [Ixodes pacificus]
MRLEAQTSRDAIFEGRKLELGVGQLKHIPVLATAVSWRIFGSQSETAKGLFQHRHRREHSCKILHFSRSMTLAIHRSRIQKTYTQCLLVLHII